MRSGYLLLETDPETPGLVRLVHSERAPAEGAPNLRFAARFDDVDAALMHCHEGLRQRLADLDRRLYTVDIRRAVAVADAIELTHRRVYCDPALAADPAVRAAREARRRRHRRRERLFGAVGAAAVALLVLLNLVLL